MKKPNIIIGKKQIILAGMTLVLGVAIYINYAFSAVGGQIKKTDVVKTQSVNYGDAQLVSENKNKDTKKDYFTQARIDKMNARDEAQETLKNIMSGGDTTDEEKSVASKDAAVMSGLVESENKIESLVKAAGFQDCVVYLDGKNANVVVKTESKELQSSEAAQIKDILLSEVSVDNENIRIYDVQ